MLNGWQTLGLAEAGSVLRAHSQVGSIGPVASRSFPGGKQPDTSFPKWPEGSRYHEKTETKKELWAKGLRSWPSLCNPEKVIQNTSSI